MGLKNFPGVDGQEDISQAKDEFDQWRAQRRSKRERIPERLWARAVNLAKRHGVWRLAGLLHLNSADLGRRLALAEGVNPTQQAKSKSKSKALQFVEMVVPPTVRAPLASHTTEPGRAECVVDLVNAQGLRMRVELNADAMSGLPALCKTFLSAP